MAVSPDSITGIAISEVTQQIDKLNNIGDKYQSLLNSALQRIASVTVDSVSSPSRPIPPSAKPPSVLLSALPDFEPPALRKPVLPDGLDIDRYLRNLDISDLDIPLPPDSPLIQIPESPGMSAISAPTRPDIVTSVTMPDEPVLTIPDMEELEKISLPVFEFPELPIFDATPPDPAVIAVPNVFINWVEPEYESELYDDLIAKVREMMEGGTGLPPAIEGALFSRTRERDSAETHRAVQEAMDVWASRGFSMPPGMLVKAVNVAREEGRLKAAETNRDILVQAATWEIENIRFAVQQGVALEQLTQNLFENMAKRLFEVARFSAEAQINVFNARISLFNAQNEAFKVLAEVYRTKLDGALAKLTAYKTAVDAQVALGQINQQRVEVFKARLSSVQLHVQVYESLVRGAQVKAEAIKSQFDAYRTDVQAYAERIGAEKVKFDAYESRIKGEQAKAGIFDSQTRAYASTVQAVANKADIQAKVAQIQMDAARVKISEFTARIDAYKAELQAGLSEVQHVAQAYQSKLEAWRAGSSANTAEAEMQSRFADMNTRTLIAYAEMQISEYQARMQKSVQEAQIALEAAKALGQYTAQLAAGAMSAAHVGASISGSGTSSTSDSKSVNYSYEMTS